MGWPSRQDENAVTWIEHNHFAVEVDFHLPFQDEPDMTIQAPVELYKFPAEFHQAQLLPASFTCLESNSSRRCFPRHRFEIYSILLHLKFPVLTGGRLLCSGVGPKQAGGGI